MNNGHNRSVGLTGFGVEVVCMKLNVMAAFVAFSFLLVPAKVSEAVGFTGTGSAVFGIPTPSMGKIYDGVGTNEFKNGKVYTGQEPTLVRLDSLAFLVGPGVNFPVVHLTFFNGVTVIGSTVDSVPVNLTVNFTGPRSFGETLSFWFEFDVTRNQPDDPDFLIVHDLPVSKTFDIGGDAYYLDLLGFSNDNGATIISTFELAESTTLESDLWAQIRPVPEPSTILLFGAAGLLLRVSRSVQGKKRKGNPAREKASAHIFSFFQ